MSVEGYILKHEIRNKISNLIYIYKSETGWLAFFVCVLLGDGGLLLSSGGRFLFGQFLGNDLFLGNDNNGVVFSLGSVRRVYFFACFWGCY
jgi:hypothetical protein